MIKAMIEQPPYTVLFGKTSDWAWLGEVFTHRQENGGPTFLQGTALINGKKTDVLVNLDYVVLFSDVPS